MAWFSRIILFGLIIINFSYISLCEDSSPTASVSVTATSKTKSVVGNGKQVSPTSTTVDSTNCTHNGVNGTSTCNKGNTGAFGYLKSQLSDKPMLMRTFFVLLGVTGIVLLYFAVRTIRSRRRKSKSRKYGLISPRGDNMELTPLDQDDEEDDMTVFDINHK